MDKFRKIYIKMENIMTRYKRFCVHIIIYIKAWGNENKLKII